MAAQPVVHLTDHQVDQAAMRTVADDGVQQVTDRPGQRLGLQARHDHLADQVIHVGIVDVVERHPGQPGTLGDHPGTVRVRLQPLAQSGAGPQ